MSAGTGRSVGPPFIAAREIAAGRFAGIAWRTVRDGSIVDAGLAGHADARGLRPLADDDLYRIYSMTKPVVSVAALQLVEEGALSLGDPVSRWLPAFARSRVLRGDGSLVEAGRPVRIEDLLTHRGGFSYDFSPGCAVADLYRRAELLADGSRSLGELVDVLGTLPLVHEPGARWHYGYGTDVLGRVLELVDERPLREVLRARVLDPLGMSDTAFGTAPEAHHRLLPMYGSRPLHHAPEAELDERDQRLDPLDVSRSCPADAPDRFARGGLGLVSTMADYALFVESLAGGGPPLLSGPMLELLWTNRLPRSQRPIGTAGKRMDGYGWGLAGRIMVDPGEALHLTGAGEGGWAGAASTWFWVDRARRLSGIVLAQYIGSAVRWGSACRRPRTRRPGIEGSPSPSSKPRYAG